VTSWFRRHEARSFELDEAALLALVPRVRRWVVRYAGPRRDVEDLVQEALTELVASLPRFRGDASLTTYAYRIVVRATARELRKQRRLPLDFSPREASEATDSIDPERRLLDEQAITELYEALDTLSEKLREAFVLASIEQMPHAEAAALVGTSLETFRQRLKRARTHLEQRLGERAISTHRQPSEVCP
jgi:RNA polymerase sigma-70 factor (ECF subfamily)